MLNCLLKIRIDEVPGIVVAFLGSLEDIVVGLGVQLIDSLLDQLLNTFHVLTI